jgi:protocatechuate 3,4-dioxygenase beta subunit
VTADKDRGGPSRNAGHGPCNFAGAPQDLATHITRSSTMERRLSPAGTNTPLLSRREATAGLFAAFGTLALGCSDDGGSSGAVDGGAGGADAAGGATGADAAAGAGDSAGSAASWASGGTKNLAASYPDPFATPVSSCVLAPTATEGPCTEAADQVRKDISEGYPGLPTRLALKVVNNACQPIAGATVKVWHTQITGSYSGNTPNPGMCVKDQADIAKHYFRGAQTTGASGRADFDTCFPGWYRGRAIHIHYTVSLNGKAYTSQIVFDQSLVNDIFTTHSDYKSYGLPDTPNASDNVVGGSRLAEYVATASRMSDGALLAAKLLVVSV